MLNITSHQWRHSCHAWLQLAFVKCKSNLQQTSPHTYKNCDYQFCVERMWKKGNPYVLLAEIQISVVTMENRCFLKKLKLELPCNPAVPLLYPSKGNSNTILKYICTPVFNAAPPTIAKTWNQQEFIKKWMDFFKCGIYTIKYYSVIKRRKSCHLWQHRWILRASH